VYVSVLNNFYFKKKSEGYLYEEDFTRSNIATAAALPYLCLTLLTCSSYNKNTGAVDTSSIYCLMDWIGSYAFNDFFTWCNYH
jgi:hypothetical protein